MRSWLQFLVLSAVCLLVFAGLRCQPDPVTPGTGGTGGEAAATPTVGGSGGWENPFTGGAPGSGGSVVACDAVERSGRPRALQPRVTNGEDVPDGAFPWVCSVQTQTGWHYCACSLIDHGTCLTAAHCSVDRGDVVICGRTRLSTSGGETRFVKAVRSHPGWQATTSGDDVSLLLLDEPIMTIAPVTIGAVNTGKVSVLGWGRTSEGGPASDTLKLGAMDLKSCAPYGSSIDDTMICASGVAETGGIIDGCSGDSGGPLLQLGVVVGITSWGNGCARPGFPGVWTDVGAELSWIGACRW